MAQDAEKNILVSDISLDKGNETNVSVKIPELIYEEDYLGQKRLKYQVIDDLKIESVKKVLFNLESILFSKETEEPKRSEEYSKLLLEEYKIMLDTSEKMMDRRQGTNNFYISLCSAMLTVMVAFITKKTNPLIWSGVTFALSLILCFLCYNWKKTLESYGQSNEAKYEVLNAIEKRLPASIFASEWEYAHKIDYSSYSTREIKIPWVFMILFGIIAFVSGLIVIVTAWGYIF